LDVSGLRETCARRGLTMTGQREAILLALEQLGEHPNVQEIVDRARDMLPRITFATVYRTMTRFEQAGGVRKIYFGEGFVRFERSDKLPHCHLIDTETGRVIEFHDTGIEEQLRVQAQALGFRTVSMRLTLFGRALQRS
jgi:Fe2+ or Zn2+ uptake regulation protein